MAELPFIRCRKCSIVNCCKQSSRAKAALDKCGVKLRADLSDGQLDFNIQGLGHFRNSVVFAKVENGPILDQLSHIAGRIHQNFLGSIFC